MGTIDEILEKLLKDCGCYDEDKVKQKIDQLKNYALNFLKCVKIKMAHRGVDTS
ncbi:hypothetical protein KAU09_04845 [Candidatus Parcubacteria bacterium]|nr:hypothetical protein [Candidatus Parcubacteria bacterium]